MAFATADDVQTRLGRTLTDAQQASAELLVELASELVADACGKASDTLDAQAVPMLRIVCLEATSRAIGNPEGLASLNERLGAWASTRNYRDAGLYLTDVEERLVRRGVFGSNSGSSRPLSTSDEVYDYLYS